jgi:hypothetical protein
MSTLATLAANHSGSGICPSEPILRALGDRVAVLGGTLAARGSWSVSEYTRSIQNTNQSFQPRSDLAAAVGEYVGELLGPGLAKRVAEQILEWPVALTANHHGVDTFAQSVQGTLLFALEAQQRVGEDACVPVFACGNIPLDNLTFPRGMLVYGAAAPELSQIPLKLAVFSNRFRRQLVSRAPGIDAGMLADVGKRVVRLEANGTLPVGIAKTLRRILDEDFASSDVLAMNRYSDQAVVVNAKLWQRLFSVESKVPDLVYLELEQVATRLLLSDVFDPSSLFYQLIYRDHNVRALFGALDGERACWQADGLRARLECPDQAVTKAPSTGCGTFLFWGVSETGRRVPLTLVQEHGVDLLKGMDDRGVPWEQPLDPRELAAALLEGKLLPSVYTCFLVISLARGLTCTGGYYQAEYLPCMRDATVRVLHSSPGSSAGAHLVAAVPCDAYLSGMQTVMCSTADGALIPAGPLEIAASGGLTPSDLDCVGSLTVRDAHVASLLETLPDAAPILAEGPAWWRPVSSSLANRLGSRIPVVAWT